MKKSLAYINIVAWSLVVVAIATEIVYHSFPRPAEKRPIIVRMIKVSDETAWAQAHEDHEPDWQIKYNDSTAWYMNDTDEINDTLYIYQWK